MAFKARTRLAASVTILLVYYVTSVYTKCPWEVLAPLPFVLEYAIWRGWHQAVIYSPHTEQSCEWATVRLIKCLGVNGIASTFNASSGTHVQSRLGVLIIAPTLKNNATGNLETLLYELHRLQMDTTSYDWLITSRSQRDFKHVNNILNKTAIRFDQNIIVAYPSYKYRPEKSLKGLCDNNFVYGKNNHPQQGIKSRTLNCNKENDYSKNCFRNQFERAKPEQIKGYYRSTERFKNLSRHLTYNRNGNTIWPLYNTGAMNYNYSRSFKMTNVSQFSVMSHISPEYTFVDGNATSMLIHLMQYFKVRINSTLYANHLGIWSRESSMSHVEIPYPVEARNFLGEELVVGRCNGTDSVGSPALDDDSPAAPTSMDDVLYFLAVHLNATSSTRYFSKLGFRTYEGTWTGLLGALMDNTVDIALEPVTVHISRHQNMDFIFPIAETMCNIYIRQQETSTVRDIFLAPFSARLMACVVAVAVAASMAVVVVSKLAPSIKNEPHRMGYTEAVIWSTGILCQQGGTWTPPNPAASVLLIVCLFFAVVTYNAYAAFITSVLSVRVASVDTVAAVLRSPDFKIGYIKNGADQQYLMSTKDAQLNAFYIRGYTDAENLVASAEEGLSRAASQDYAFFAGQRAARNALRSLSQARGRCAVREVPVHSTRAQLSFPLPRNSPYARPALLSLLRFRSGGGMSRLGAALVPDMPQCAPPAGFASARAADVRSALILLAVGYITALFIGLAEFCWKNRKELLILLANCIRRLIGLLPKL